MGSNVAFYKAFNTKPRSKQDMNEPVWIVPWRRLNHFLKVWDPCHIPLLEIILRAPTIAVLWQSFMYAPWTDGAKVDDRIRAWSRSRPCYWHQPTNLVDSQGQFYLGSSNSTCCLLQKTLAAMAQCSEAKHEAAGGPVVDDALPSIAGWAGLTATVVWMEVWLIAPADPGNIAAGSKLRQLGLSST